MKEQGGGEAQDGHPHSWLWICLAGDTRSVRIQACMRVVYNIRTGILTRKQAITKLGL